MTRESNIHPRQDTPAKLEPMELAPGMRKSNIRPRQQPGAPMPRPRRTGPRRRWNPPA